MPGSPPRFRGFLALRNQIGGMPVDMEAHFLIELLFELVAPQKALHQVIARLLQRA